MTTKQKKRTLILAAAITVIALLIYVFNWNMLRGFVEQRVAQSTGRALHIGGDLDVDLSLTPRITLNDVTFANAPWSATPTMASFPQAVIEIDLRSLWRADIVVPLVQLVKPHVVLEKNGDGAANWVLGKPTADSDDRRKTVRIGTLQIEDGQLAYQSVPDRANLQITLQSSTDADQHEHHLKVSVRGTYLDQDTEAQGHVGAISNVTDLQRSFPLRLTGHVGKTTLKAEGTIDRLAHLDGLHLKFSLAGESLADLFPLLGVPLPATPPYSLSGKVDQSGQRWNLQQLRGTVGSSDIQGRFAVDRAPRPQFMSGDLQSSNLDLKDLSGFIGARTESGKTIVDANKVLPARKLSFAKLHSANADIKLHGKRIQTERLPIDDLTVHLKLKDGRLLLDPLNFGVAGGDISATINLDTNESPIRTNADIQLRKIRFDSLFPGLKLQKANAGIIGGRARFSSRGDSIAAMLGSADGQLAFMMHGGSVSQLAVRLANLDVANSIVLFLGGDRSLQIRCMVVDLDANDGNMQAKTIVLDTTKSIINGKGNINFKDESLDLRLTADSKSASLAALRGPIVIGGTFKKPTAAPSLKNVSGRVAAAAALGAIAPPLALLPLLDLGNGEDSDCAELLNNATAHGKEPPP